MDRIKVSITKKAAHSFNDVGVVILGVVMWYKFGMTLGAIDIAMGVKKENS